MGDPVSGTLTHVILTHTVKIVPNIILRRIYSRAKLAAKLRLNSPPSQSVIIDQQALKLKIRWPITNLLPFDVEFNHIELDLKLNHSASFFQVQYSRRIEVKCVAETVLELPAYDLTMDHIHHLRSAQPKTLWLSGCVDFDAKFSTFTVKFSDLQTEPLIVNNPLDTMSIAEYRKLREQGRG